MTVSSFDTVGIAGLAVAVPRNKVLNHFSVNSSFPEKKESLNSIPVIKKRHISPEEQTSSDLGYIAANELIDKFQIDRSLIGILIFISRTPDYRNPISAAVLQHRLKLVKDCLVYDINMGNTGFITGLQLGSSLLASMDLRYALVITGDTSSKLYKPEDPGSLICGDAASALLLEKDSTFPPFTCLSLSSSTGFNSYILREGGFRLPGDIIKNGEPLSADSVEFNRLSINAEDFHSFVRQTFSGAAKLLLEKAGSTIDLIDYFVFQQENEALIRELSESLGIPKTKLPVMMEEYGVISGASVPLVIAELSKKSADRRLQIFACSFGEGFSMGLAAFSVNPGKVLQIIESDDFFNGGSASHEI